ncbi:MAG TPA: rhodanese-like domain-containing protein [Gammaproteobacteria bacterium]|nr:rhodanese-like domain-containing protein [Gammaproteobacteria bacterium]
MNQRQRIVCEEARQLVADGAYLVDVRTPREYARDALPGAVNVPLQNLLVGVQQLEKDKPIILYCASGMRSQQAAQALSIFGHAAVHDLGGLRNC